MKNKHELNKNPIMMGFYSLLIPGLGQGICRRWYRGVSILLAVFVVSLMVIWYGKPAWYFSPIGIWIWNIWDAYSLAKGKTRSLIIPLVFGLVSAYGIGWQVVQINFAQADISRGIAVAKPMLRPDFITLRTETNKMWTKVYVPCPLTGTVPVAERQDGEKFASVTPSCAGPTDPLTVTVTGMWPNTDTRIWWETNIGDPMVLGGNEDSNLVEKTDVNGSLTTTIRIPLTILIGQPDLTIALDNQVHFDQSRPIGGYTLSENGHYVVKGMLETIMMAFMATILAIFLAIPVSFLAARNLMGGNPITFTIYLIVRTLLNVVRSIESLIIAIVFVVIVGLGPFAGVLALAFHSIAALAKLYSEVIEGIDPGPIEAVRSTGANWVQVVRYGVIPQIIPPFTSFTIYRWDINIRTATIIGMVGGGGIGFYLIQWISLNQLRAVSSSFIAIAIVVMILDYVSAKVRERLV